MIGESSYRHALLLAFPNARNDAAAFATSLRKLAFEVREFHDLDKSRIERELFAFELRANGADVGLVYYAGHGMERNSAPFAIPVGAKVAKDTTSTAKASR